MQQTNRFDCPSSTPDIPDSQIFGVVEGTIDEPKVTYLRHPLPVTPDVLAAADPVEPTEIFRFVGRCLERRCQQFGNGQCQLAKRLVQGLPTVTQELPHCAIRQCCRWWHQEGKAACWRCPQIVRTNYYLSDPMRQAIMPPTLDG
jgi:hypothetical protein